MSNKHISILIVDDDVHARTLLSEHLSFDYTCVAVGSAEEADAIVGEDSFDVLIAAGRMRGASGLDLCKRVKKRNPNTTVLIMLERGDKRCRIGALLQGACDLVIKPLELSKVSAWLERSLSGHSITTVPHLPSAIANNPKAAASDGERSISSSLNEMESLHNLVASSACERTKWRPSDKRDAKRVYYLCEAECEGAGMGRLNTRINDLSVGGVFVDTMTGFPVGSLVKLRFPLAATEIRVVGEVRYCMPQIGIGVKFLDLSPRHHELIEKTIQGMSGPKPVNYAARPKAQGLSV